MSSMHKKITEVAAAIFWRKTPDIQVLLALRPHGKAYGGYWEFPGGKMEAGETPMDALIREIHEELGVSIHTIAPFQVREHDYPHAFVRLYFFLVGGFERELSLLEHDGIVWQSLSAINVSPLLPANHDIFDDLAVHFQH